MFQRHHSHQFLHYAMSMHLLNIVYGIEQKITDGDAPQLAVARAVAPQLALAPLTKCSVSLFHSMCQSELQLSPFTAQMNIRVSTFPAAPICIRLLALIDMSEKRYLQLPLRHSELLKLIRETRETRRNNCETESDLIACAKNVLHQYSQCPDDVYANARFLS